MAISAEKFTFACPPVPLTLAEDDSED